MWIRGDFAVVVGFVCALALGPFFARGAVALENPLSAVEQENRRIVPFDSLEGQLFHQEGLAILKRLLPSHDFEADPVVVLLSTSPGINAFSYPQLRPRVIVFHRDMVNFLDTADQFAYVAGLEWVRNYLGKIPGAPATEVQHLEWMHQCGMDVRQARDLIQKMLRDVNQITWFGRNLDTRAVMESRLILVETELSSIDAKHGGLQKIGTPLSPALLQATARGKHTSFLEDRCGQLNYSQQTIPGKLQILAGLLPLISEEHSGRRTEMFRLLRELIPVVDPANADHREASQRFLETTLSTSQGYGFYAALAPRSSRGSRPRPTGRLQPIEDAIHRFIVAPNRSLAEEAAESLNNEITLVNLPSHFLQSVAFSNFRLPDMDAAQRIESRRSRSLPRVRRFRVEWNSHVKWALELQSSEIAFALVRMGVFDPRLADAVKVGDLSKLKSLQSKSVAAVSNAARDLIHDYFILESGAIIPRYNANFGPTPVLSERIDRRLEVEIPILFDEARAGDSESRQQLREIAAQSGTPEFMGLEHLGADSELFFYINREAVLYAFGGYRNEPQFSAQREASLATDLLARLRSLIAEDEAKHAPLVRKFFLDRPMYRFDEPVHLPGDTALINYVLTDPDRLFEATEKVRALSDVNLFWRHELRNGEQTAVPFDSGSLNRLRKAFEYKEPNSYQKLLQTVKYLDALGRYINHAGPMPADAVTFLDYLRMAEVMFYVGEGVPPANKYRPIVEALNPYLLRHQFFQGFLVKLVRLTKNRTWAADAETLAGEWLAAEAADLFPDDGELRYAVLAEVVASLARINEPYRREQICGSILSTGWIAHPNIRERVLDIWSSAVADQFGIDSEVNDYAVRLRKRVTPLIVSVGVTDRIDLLTRLFGKVEGQSQVAYALHSLIGASDPAAVGTSQWVGELSSETLEAIRENPRQLQPILDFLIRPLTGDSAAAFIEQLQTKGGVMLFTKNPLVHARNIYGHFWAASFAMRIRMVSELVTNQTEAIESLTARLLPLRTPFAQESRSLFLSYAESVDDSQRFRLLAAILGAVHRLASSNESPSVGARLALVFELMGPAETSFGEVVHSNPNAPSDVTDGMGRLKSYAAPPLPWDLFELFHDTLPEELARQLRVKRIIGSGAHYIVLEVEQRVGRKVFTKALALQRRYVKERGDRGFDMLLALANRLVERGQVSPDLLHAITLNKRFSDLSLDDDYGASQFDVAEELYRLTRVSVNSHEFTFDSVNVEAHGPGYRLMDLAPGVLFNDLPEVTQEQRTFKSELAKGYVALELSLLLQGKRFDHSRHGAKMRVNGHSVKLFGFSGIAIEEPTAADRLALADLVFELLHNSTNLDNLGSSVIEEVRRSALDKPVPDHILRVQKAIVALSDFLKYVRPDELPSIILAILARQNVHSEVQDHFLQRYLADPTPFSIAASCPAQLEILISKTVPAPRRRGK